MGIRLFSSKNFLIFIGIFSLIASLLYILEVLIKIKILKLLLSLLVMIINLKIPDIIFIIIVLAFLIWLILINRKLKKLPLTDKKKKLKLTKEQDYILALIAGSTEMLSDSNLLNTYKREFSGAHIVEVKSISVWLKKNGLIEHSGTLENEFYYTATDEGIEYVSKKYKVHRK